MKRNGKKSIRSIRRGERLTIFILILFFIGMILLVIRIVSESSFYMTYSSNVTLGCVYDCNGDILFDPDADAETYGEDYFLDIGNVIGDDSGQMTNTLVSENLESLQNYSLIFGTSTVEDTAIYCTLNHTANQAVYDAFGDKDGTAIAYNYETGEILICISKPSVNILDYSDVDSLEEGSLICKAFYGTVPGSTQKVATTAAALEEFGYESLLEKTYTCTGSWTTIYSQEIVCHNSSGHGTQNIIEAFANSCNPFFAQLVQDMSLDNIIEVYTNMGIAVNDEEVTKIDIDGISSYSASVTLTDTSDFDTMWNCMGQSEALTSPCQMMLWESAIANGTGVITEPYFISSITDVSGFTSYTAETTYGDSEIFSAETAQHLRDIMLQNGTENYSSIGYTVGVKSGTAEVESTDTENSLLVGFCTDEDLPIAFAVMIEDRVDGDITTSDIVRAMLQALDT